MIDLDRHRMLSPLSVSSSDVLIQDDKFPSSSHLYLRQQHTVQIIQLVEGPPPSPRHINGNTASSCDYSSEDSESSDEDDGDDDDEEEEEESVCSSYCSSDLSPEQLPRDYDSNALRPGSSSQTYSLPLKRILAWRENFSTQPGATLSGDSFSSLKRKIHIEDDDDRDDDSTSHSSKRTRSRSRSQSSSGDASAASIDMHSCPACDLSFPTPQSLQQHGRDAEATNEACSVAVRYAFE